MVSSINKQMHAGREGMVTVPSKRLHFLIDKFYNEEKMFSVVMEKEQKINELKLLLYQQQMTNRELQEKLLQSYYNPHAYDTVSQSTMRENFIRGMNRATLSDYLDINAGCTVPYISQHPDESFLDGFNIGGDDSSTNRVEGLPGTSSSSHYQIDSI
ncbi:uncharacterized protein LOC106869506 [Octopus bimaculoides]|uniref:uncharacterized protein LOC106869506 n=1 Tax=Octopus bimaculoides TaxID=37653 RepID=UPI00071CAB4D|nr:uncharacterized protein LOC106869506 [Octopus bimaculoides]|eukprot:XP_014770759.1 PREDICTED: uncharacterized protein LOC106869506 [Octopus bimaculoides]